MAKHELLATRMGSAVEPYPATPDGQADIYRPSSLDKALADLAGSGRRILGFWRSGSRWIIKVMAVR